MYKSLDDSVTRPSESAHSAACRAARTCWWHPAGRRRVVGVLGWRRHQGGREQRLDVLPLLSRLLDVGHLWHVRREEHLPFIGRPEAQRITAGNVETVYRLITRLATRRWLLQRRTRCTQNVVLYVTSLMTMYFIATDNNF